MKVHHTPAPWKLVSLEGGELAMFDEQGKRIDSVSDCLLMCTAPDMFKLMIEIRAMIQEELDYEYLSGASAHTFRKTIAEIDLVLERANGADLLHG